jgi:hypothetical protein
LKLEVNGKKDIPIDGYVLSPKKRNTFITYQELKLPYSGEKVKSVKLFARIPGSENTFKVEVNAFPSFQLELEEDHSFTPLSILEHNEIVNGVESKVLFFRSDSIIVDEEYIVPKGFSLSISSPQSLMFKSNGKLIIEGKLIIQGGEEDYLSIQSETADMNIEVIQGELIVQNAELNKCERFFHFDQSKIFMKNIVVADVESYFISAIKSDIVLSSILTGSVNRIGRLDRVNLEIEDLTSKKGELAFS